MSIFAKVTSPPVARTQNTKQITIFYAGLLTVFLVAQLFTFDSFIELIPSLNLPLNGAWAYVVAPLIVASEVFALPYLLRMNLSVAFRWVSMALGLLVPVLWFFICLWVVLTQPDAESVGFLGTVVAMVPGWWAVMASVALGILGVWAAWGLWPGKRSSVAKK